MYNRDSRNDRLGAVPLPHSVHIGIPYPVKLNFPAKRFTALAAGGWYEAHRLFLVYINNPPEGLLAP